MTDWIIINQQELPALILSAWLAFTMLGVSIWREIDPHCDCGNAR